MGGEDPVAGYRGRLEEYALRKQAWGLAEWLSSHARGDVLALGPAAERVAALCTQNGLRVVTVAEPAQLELPDGEFDSVLVAEALERSREPAAVVRELARLASPEATIAITARFGLNADPAHRSTFLVGSLLDTLSPHLTVTSLELAEEHFRVIARAGPMDGAARTRLIVELQPLLESRFLEAQVEARTLDDLARRQRGQLARARRRRRYQARRARRLREKLRETRRRSGRGLVRTAARLAPRFRPQRDGAADARAAPAKRRRPRVEIPAIEPPEGPVRRPDLTVAVILDRFSALALRYEWNQLEFGPLDWRPTLERDPPRLLFVESAWQGNDGRWAGMMRDEGPTEPLRDLVAWCRERGIPSVFWAKEDPPNFDRFLETARLFDHVFTVDGDCIPRYREALGHDRVGLMQFAAQPRIHNPIAVEGGREYDVAFAGSYFASKHPARREQMDTVLEPALEAGLHVFSRLPDVPGRDFPERYAGHVAGSLPYERVLAAYKRYKLFLNVNSVPDSPTMCARRVFEISACSTPVLSGDSRAIEEVFGELVPIARTREEARARLTELLGDPERRDRRAHRAMREVLAAHTYAHRLESVLAAVGIEFERRRPSASVLMTTNRERQLDHAIAQVAGQAYRPLQLVAVLHGLELDPETVAERARRAGIEDVVVIEADAAASLGACLNLALEAADGELLAKMDDDDFYGRHYLADLVDALQYADAPIVGKCAHYSHTLASGATMLRFPHLEHTHVEHVKGATITAKADVLRALRFDDVRVGVDNALFARVQAEGIRVYSADRFSFVAVRHGGEHGHTWAVSEGRLMSTAGSVSYGPPETLVEA
jgi:spore maturation protein CgeB